MSETFTSGGYIVMPAEAEQLIEHLKEQPLDTLGASKDWMAYHHTIEKLNLQAHQSAQRKQDNFVVESLVTYQKFSTIVANLLSVEMWKANVFPLLKCQDDDSASLRLYYILYHEAALVNLLEVAFYHEHVVETMDDDMMLEMIDYSVRKLTWLIGLPRNAIATATTFHKSGQEIVSMLESQTPKAELQRQQMEIEFRVAVQCVTIVRYIAERLHVLPLGVVSRLLDKHDVLLSLAVLIENPPWTHKDVSKDEKTGETTVKWKKFSQQKWSVVEPSDLLVLTTTEAQVWLAVYYLICTKNAREHYEVTQFRKDQLQRMRKYLNELLIDQLPLLADIQRYLDELSIMQVQSNFVGMKNTLVMEAVPYLRDNLTRKYRKEHPTIAKQFDERSHEFTRGEDLKQLAELYQMDGIDELLDDSEERRKQREEVRNAAAVQDPNEADDADDDSEPVTPKQVIVKFDNCSNQHGGAAKKSLIIEIIDDENDDIKAGDNLPGEVQVVCAVDLDSQKLVETKTTRYYRYTLRPQNPTNKATTLPLVRWNASVDARVEFENDVAPIELRCPQLELPQIQASTDKPKREKIWKQIGSLVEDSRVVVQCQLVTHIRSTNNQNEENDPIDTRKQGASTPMSYELGSLFLSVPF